MRKHKVTISSLIIKLPFYLVVFCAILCLVNGLSGYHVFKSLFEKQYKDTTEQIADTALSYIDGDRIPYYAQNPVEDVQWCDTFLKLDELTKTAQLAFIYVTVPDEKFESRIYIYDTVHPQVVNGKVYPLGKVNTLKTYSPERIEELKRVMYDGTSGIQFAYTKTGGHVTTSIPVRNSSGDIVAILSVVKPMSEVKEFKTQYLRSTFITSATFTIIFAVIYILILLYRVIKPLVLITNETAEFAHHRGALTGALDKIRGTDELATLARAVEKMSVDMNKYIADLTHTTAEKERLSAELDVATQIQANMLPRIFPPYENHQELELFASMDPAKEVGGDFYDFFMIDNDHFAVVVGDVSGKGVPAALFMVVAKTLLKNVGLHAEGPAKVFEQVNNQLCEGNDAGLFVTCWMGVLTLSTGELRFANAGHTSPVWYHNGEAEYLQVKPNLMLAGMENMKYQEHSITINHGDRLFVYTDGVTEATNANNELYGEERLLSSIKQLKSKSSKEFLAGVRRDIDAFVGDAPQFDDITMLELVLQ